MWRSSLHESPLRLQHGDWIKSAEYYVEAFATYLGNVFIPNHSVSSFAPVTIEADEIPAVCTDCRHPDSKAEQINWL